MLKVCFHYLLDFDPYEGPGCRRRVSSEEQMSNKKERRGIGPVLCPKVALLLEKRDEKVGSCVTQKKPQDTPNPTIPF